MRSRVAASILATVALVGFAWTSAAGNGRWTIVGWNNLGMHCMDADFSVFTTLPPYNTIQAHVMDPNGSLVTSAAGITVTYQAVADPTGSINTSSRGKSNFWQFAQSLFRLGQPLPEDTGLTGVTMPGTGNAPRPMTFDAARNWFIAEGIPITPYDDTRAKNAYPMMRLTVRDAAGQVLATTDIVLPVSDEMDCRACHASGSGSAARPVAGWVNDPNAERDYRLNIIRIHDDRRGSSLLYRQALANAGYLGTGLFDTVTTAGKPILCAACHASEALGTPSFGSIPALTTSIHGLHAGVTDPLTGMTLDNTANRSACYRCHPGSTTKCLRGAMGAAVATDGSMAMQCQGCHGVMSAVGASGRRGWLDEPGCQSCHTGTATSNNGQIRYTSVFDTAGHRRAAVNATFATNPDTPAAGFSLFRFSRGHGGLQCEACHGSTHAEFPSTHGNDNVQSRQAQGHVGVIGDCLACHATQPSTVTGGPHGMHPVGQGWIEGHKDAASDGRAAQCQACHGVDYRGTVLSRAQGDRTISAFGSKAFWRGFQIGCYTCHRGPTNSDVNPNRPPQAVSVSATTHVGVPVELALVASDPDGNPLTLRVVSQPAHGTTALAGSLATYYPDADFTGSDTFTFAAWDGSTQSNLATATIAVAAGPTCTVVARATVPGSGTVGVPVSFQGTATSQGCTSPIAYDWNFGDGSVHAATQNASHTYGAAGRLNWTLTASAGSVSSSVSGALDIAVAPCTLTIVGVAPTAAQVGVPVQFPLVAGATGCGNPVLYDWSFGDGTPHVTLPSPSHTYTSRGTFGWTLDVSSGTARAHAAGSVAVSYRERRHL